MPFGIFTLRRLSVLIALAAPLLVRLALIPRFPAPEPRVHDEFAFLLGADTFLHGRIANPQHPFWMHFEAPHILVRPVYASAFPMAQSAVLAFGKLLGHPWIGVWLSTGLMCGAICWMLQGWVPLRWALVGALLAALRFGISSYWMNSYWGGSVAAIGGALALGALPRILRRLDSKSAWKSAAPLGIGLAILANSRPVEGSVFGLGIAIVLLANWSRRMWTPILTLAAILIPAALAMGYSFARITGKPWVAPYVLYRESMTMAPHFVWQSPRPEPVYNNHELRTFYAGIEMMHYRESRTLRGFRQKAEAYWRFYFGPVLTLPLLAAFFLWRSRKMRRLFLIGFLFLLALAGQVWHNVHYAAPAAGLAILIAIEGLRLLRVSRWPWTAWLVLAACVGVFLAQIVAGAGTAGWRWPLPGGVLRASVVNQFHRMGGKHLVFVRYGASHDAGDEWVYNDADIDGSSIVWARELDHESNVRLMRYFADRKVWVMEPDIPRLGSAPANPDGEPPF